MSTNAQLAFTIVLTSAKTLSVLTNAFALKVSEELDEIALVCFTAALGLR